MVWGRISHRLVPDPPLLVPGAVGAGWEITADDVCGEQPESGEGCLAPLPRVLWPLVNHCPSFRRSFALCSVCPGGFISFCLLYGSWQGTQHHFCWSMRYRPFPAPSRASWTTWLFSTTGHLSWLRVMAQVWRPGVLCNCLWYLG